MIVVSYRKEDETQVLGTAKTPALAVAIAVEFLKSIIDEEDRGAASWEEAVEQWEDLTDGYEDFTFVETTPRKKPARGRKKVRR